MRAGMVLAGRYRLETKLGAGGMGEVWRARHLTLDTDVAVKLIIAKASDNEAMRTRFEREAKATAQLKTPHVVQVFDYGVEGDLPFLVMELLDGQDLGALGRTRAAFSLEEVAELISQAALGLTAAHLAGVVHRDIKPGNLFVARVAGAKPLVKVLDFGIAKITDVPQLTAANMVLGSPSYMSPEQIRGKPLDGRTDTWSLAVVAFLMLAGELPFQGNGPHDVAEKILRGERLRLAAVAPHHPDALDRVFDRAFSVDRELRFGSATEFAGALEAATRASAPAVADDAESSGAVTARNPEPRADFAAAETAPQAARALQSPQRELAIDDVRAPTVASEPIEVVAPTEGRRAFRGTMRMDAGQVAAAARASAGAAPATAEPTQGVAPTVGTPAWVEQGPGGPGAQEITLEPTSRKAEQGKRSRAAAAVVVAIAVGGLVVFGVLLLRAGALQPHLAGATVKSGEVPAARPDGEGKAPSATTAGSTAGTSTSGGAPSASSAATERRSGSAAATASAAPALTGKLPTQARAPTATATALPLGL